MNQGSGPGIARIPPPEHRRHRDPAWTEFALPTQLGQAQKDRYDDHHRGNDPKVLSKRSFDLLLEQQSDHRDWNRANDYQPTEQGVVGQASAGWR